MNELTKEKVVKAGLWSSIALTVLILPTIVVWVGVNGIGAINWEFLTGRPYRFELGGIFPQIVGSVYLVSLSTLLGAPLGIASAIYLAEYAPDNVITRTVRFLTETLAGMPSIVIGLFGLEFLVFMLQLKTSLLAGAVSLSFLMLPWTIRASEESMKMVPGEYREASLALGATKWQTILKVVLPAASPGIITGVLLGTGKAVGETTVVWLTAGSGLEAFIPRTLRSPTGSLPMYIYLLATQGHTSEAMSRAFGASLVLLAMFLAVSVSALMVRNYYLRKLGTR
jgi:phosphate transport system permease protein